MQSNKSVLELVSQILGSLSADRKDEIKTMVRSKLAAHRAEKTRREFYELVKKLEKLGFSDDEILEEARKIVLKTEP